MTPKNDPKNDAKYVSKGQTGNVGVILGVQEVKTLGCWGKHLVSS